MKDNFIKLTCKELGLTYKQLAEEVGYSESAVKMARANDKVSEPMKKAVELYLENMSLKEKLEDFTSLTAILKKHI